MQRVGGNKEGGEEKTREKEENETIVETLHHTSLFRKIPGIELLRTGVG